MPGKVSKEYKSRIVKLHQDFYPKDVIINNNEIIQTAPLEIPIKIDINQDKNISCFNKYFDKIYVINLDRRPDRWALCKAELDKYNIIAERFSAIDGETLEKNNFLNNGEIGCCKSHAVILKNAITYGYKRILILEDDVIFLENASEIFEQNINFVPLDWQMLYLGGNHINDPVKIFPNSRISKIRRTYTTSSYAVSNKQKLLNNLIISLEQLKEPADVCYSRFHMGCACYSFYPGICFQRPGLSDITNTYADHTGVIR